ncbi:hypothetical protein ACTS95_03850 [Empedobacter brevis]|uniref:hypothetical protein n=2 Tax=Empedobacter brevis TaxID=247 RepID=UPI0028A7168B|nr:hypothetical protein [Empedobacter brevis]
MTLEKIETEFIIDDGSPSPKILSDSNNLFLNFMVDDENFNTITLKFLNYHIYKIGYPGNETLCYHPYTELGINSSDFYLVNDSMWMNELREIDKNHPYFSDKKWNSLNHYIITFHDDLFECIAKGFETTSQITFENIIF